MEINYKKLAEKICIKRLITETYPTGVVSLVGDTFDFWRTISEIAAELKEEILARQPNELGLAKVVFRPDSGDPADILCGTAMRVKTMTEAEYDKAFELGFDYVVHEDKYYKLHQATDLETNAEYYSITEVPYHPSYLGAVEILWNIFGGTETEKGFKLLNQRVGLIYGDSITPQRAYEILARLMEKGFASANVVLGIGSYTYQYLTRDSFGMAVKATWGVIDGKAVEVYKDPVTDIGKVKKSAKGLLRVEKEGNDYVLHDQQTPEQEQQGLLQTVFKDGKFYNFQSFDEIKARIKSEGKW